MTPNATIHMMKMAVLVCRLLENRRDFTGCFMARKRSTHRVTRVRTLAQMETPGIELVEVKMSYVQIK